VIGLDGCRQETARDKDIDLERRRHPPPQPATGCGRRREGVLSLLQRDERRPGLQNTLQEGDTEWPSGDDLESVRARRCPGRGAHGPPADGQW
jgi:hypothetical protein